MKKSLFSSVFALAMLALLTGCGGGGGGGNNSGGGGTGTSPTAASLLNGQYSFSFSGSNVAGPLSIVGSFAADGKGDITGGVEDVTLVKKSNNTIGAQAGLTLTGSYTVGSDGRGTLTLNTSSDGTQNFAIVVESNNQGQLIWFDNSATGSGTFNLQDTTAFSAATVNNSFAFGINGVDPSLNAYSRVGQFTAASGSVSTGESDLNNAFGIGGVNLAQTISGGSVGAPNSSTGRGTLSLTYDTLTVNYIYYVVSATTLNLIEADDQASVYGTATLQSGAPFSDASLTGNYVLSIGGTSSEGPIAEVGQFSAAGDGSLSGVDDENNDGVVTQNFTLGGVFASVTSNGRGTMGLSFPSATLSYAFYIASSSTVYLMEADVDATTSGIAMAQTGGPFTTSSLTGNYGLQFSGADAAADGVEIDSSGQVASSGTGTLSSGTIDSNFAGFDLPGQTEPYFGSEAISAGAYTVTNGTVGRGTIGFNLGTSAFGFAYYFVSPTQIVVIETDLSGQDTEGTGQIQPTIP